MDVLRLMKTLFSIFILVLLLSCNNNPEAFNGIVTDKIVIGSHSSMTVVSTSSSTIIVPAHYPETYSLSVGNDTISYKYKVSASVFYSINVGDSVTIYKNGSVKK